MDNQPHFSDPEWQMQEMEDSKGRSRLLGLALVLGVIAIIVLVILLKKWGVL